MRCQCAPHTSNDINERGESLLEFVLFTSLNVCNRDNHPTIRNKNRAEIVDVTLATNSDSLIIDNWHVFTECSFSDHYRIVFEIRWDREEKHTSGTREDQTGLNSQGMLGSLFRTTQWDS